VKRYIASDAQPSVHHMHPGITGKFTQAMQQFVGRMNVPVLTEGKLSLG
jgi:hypothetical protein